MNEAFTVISATLAAVIVLAIIATLVSQKANTAGVLQSAGTAFSSVISAAVSPVTGSGSNAVGSIQNGGIGITSIPGVGG